jgi:hypothetical protein
VITCRISREKPTAVEIAEMATRGEDISAYFTNKFTVVKPVRRVNAGLTPDRKTRPKFKK